MSYNTFREKDMQRERILSKYLDEKLYTNKLFSKAQRTDAKESQISGCDIILSIPQINLTDIIVDEKAQLHYTDGGLPTFAFELNFINKNKQRVEGWLTDESKKTEYYQLLFLTAKKDFESASEISQVEYILVKRSKILEAINLDLETIRKKGEEVSQNDTFQQFKISGNDFYYTHSTKLAESPVNIILKKSKLLTICSLHGVVS